MKRKNFVLRTVAVFSIYYEKNEGGKTVRVVSYNIRHGVGCDKRLDLERTARVIEELQPDMVGLNEVDVCFHRRSEYQDQMAWLAKRRGTAIWKWLADKRENPGLAARPFFRAQWG
jgi:endonuclease/exonuclease/phosphatase family metal-dependent hydrolase